MKIHPLVKEVLYTRKDITAKCKELAQVVNQYYQENSQHNKDNTVICLGLLKGCIPFMAMLLLDLEIEVETEYMTVSSYGGGVAGNLNPEIMFDLVADVNDRDVLLVEDIIDSGKTIKLVKDYLLGKGARTVKVVTLLDKKSGRKVDLTVDWYGFDVPAAFLIGFGLDYEERLRNLPYVAIANVEKIKTWTWEK
ncbi:hypoxanthine phosphoribosyltransferase [Spiroplasma chrysopicola]|uniref:Hypoxanthine phosphoribosyltransferase n=1 Tax=Spiroplasma chrysopicola DF-1 TaxID=1276227 RepID=R4UJ24_9MOLU|nr:hypoxanthine phosphoribosyltransferase [Spiroplasma chrysopicola]AGM25316.1 hypoxanthine-guanine phosphoribosyltransferase [Spiroplasma chrysopicola DF-1]